MHPSPHHNTPHHNTHLNPFPQNLAAGPPGDARRIRGALRHGHVAAGAAPAWLQRRGAARRHRAAAAGTAGGRRPRACGA
eukprot:213654-Chlamydomonas_euryale.AAC.1